MEARKNEVCIAGGPVGPAPEHFGEYARAEWDSITQHSEYKEVFNSLHTSALIEYCGLHELMIKNQLGLVKLSASERQMLNSLRMQLGLTPASQSKIRMPTKEKLANKFSKLGS